MDPLLSWHAQYLLRHSVSRRKRKRAKRVAVFFPSVSFLLRRTPEALTDTERDRARAGEQSLPSSLPPFAGRPSPACCPSDLGGPRWRKEMAKMAVSSSSAGPPGFGSQPWGGTSAGFLQDSFSPLTQGFDAYVLKVAAAASQAWWQMADLQASAGQTGVHFPTFFCLSVSEEDSAVQKSFFWREKERQTKRNRGWNRYWKCLQKIKVLFCREKNYAGL